MGILQNAVGSVILYHGTTAKRDGYFTQRTETSACIYKARVCESLKAHMLLKRILITCNRKYTDDS